MNFTVARHNMVENQIRTNRVIDPRVVEAMDTMPRELFVPEASREIAYLDGEIDLGGGRRLMPPMVFARLLQAAEIFPGEVALDVGCGTGYSAAILAKLASTVVALESDKVLAGRAGALLAQLGIDNVALVEAPLPDGDAVHGPYDVIVLEGSVPEVPAGLAGQLAERGRLLAVVGRPGTLGTATITVRVGDSTSTRPLFETRLAPLPGFAPRPAFVF